MALLCSGRVAGWLPLLPTCIISRVLFWREYSAAHVLVGTVRPRAAAQPPAQVAPYVCCAANTARAQAWLPLHSQAGRAGRWQHACCVSSMPHPMIQPRERRRLFPALPALSSPSALVPALLPSLLRALATHSALPPTNRVSWPPIARSIPAPARPPAPIKFDSSAVARSSRALAPAGAVRCGVVWCGVRRHWACMHVMRVRARNPLGKQTIRDCAGGLQARQGKARQGKARQGKARQGKARQGKARQGEARVATARRGGMFPADKRARLCKRVRVRVFLCNMQNISASTNERSGRARGAGAHVPLQQLCCICTRPRASR